MMKKLLAVALLALSTAAAAFPNDVWVKRSNNTDTGTVEYTINTEVDGIAWFNMTSQRLEYLRFGTNLSRQLVGDYYYLNVATPEWESIPGKPSTFTASPHRHPIADIMDATVTGIAMMSAADAAGARAAIGAGTGNSNFSGAYADLTGKPTIPTVNAPSQAAVTRTLNSSFQISTTRGALAIYSVQLTVTASIAGGQNGDVVLEIASDSGFTTNVQTLGIAGLGQTYTLAVALQGVQPQTSTVSGFVPPGYYARLRTVNNTGTPAFSVRAGQEVLL